MAATGWDFVVDRRDLHRRAVRDADRPDELADGEVLLRVDAFALTANNLTYAVTGDRFGYWQLFPADEPWGRIPAWGVGTVEGSACPDVAVGERFAGMLPMSTHLVARPRATRDGFADLAAHRAGVNPVYNRYVRVTGRPDDELERDAALRPVYILSFVLAQHLRAPDRPAASRLLVTSASSKAALGLAHVLRDDGPRVVGLTSAPHADRVRATGRYADVLAYDALGALDTDATSALVDVSGNEAVRDALRQHLGSQLVDVVQVGQTDWDRPADQVLGSSADTPPFFAPTAIQQLVAEWGPAEFAHRLDDGLAGFIGESGPWLAVDRRTGRVGDVDRVRGRRRGRGAAGPVRDRPPLTVSRTRTAAAAWGR